MPVNYCTEACDFIFRGKGKTSVWIRRTARTEGWDTGAVSVVFCSDERLLEVNNKYLNHNYFTDIITFDYSDPEKKKIAGDLMIGIGTVRDNAAAFGTTFENELQRVIIHGILHLCGYGDKTPEEAARMKSLENKYLDLFYNEIPGSAPRRADKKRKGEPEKQKK